MTATGSDLVVGVAGHIDHGKTTLVRALTGIDTDRLPEERARGITIELGFAHFVLPGGRRASVVDMPGHERFVRQTIAGAGGTDVLLLVVAADEGVMPQTREHLAVAALAGVPALVAVLAKCDAVSDELLALATDEVRELLATTLYADSPIVPVSARAGTGLDALRDVLARASVRERDRDGAVYLPIDRVFARRGFGTVVTGTLASGSVSVGDALAIGPVDLVGTLRQVRVRGLHVHGEAVAQASAGTRLAVNVVGVDAGESLRGAWLVREGECAVTRAFDAEITVLDTVSRALGRRARVELHVGAAHTAAIVAPLGAPPLAPDTRSLARVTTERAVVLRPDERFVLRGAPSLASVGSTVGGGVVVRPVVRRGRSRTSALVVAEAVRTHVADPLARARTEVDAAGARGLSPREVRERTGLVLDARTLADARLVAVSASRIVTTARLDETARRVLRTLSEHHARAPASAGLERREVRPAGDDAIVDRALADLLSTRQIARAGDRYHRAGWKPRDPDAIPFRAQIETALASAGLTAPTLRELATACGCEVHDLDAAIRRLVERGAIERVSAELYVDHAALAALESRLVAYLTAHATIDAQGFKALTGATRKWAIPLAEHFDAKHVTLRVGEMRRLRGV